MRELEHWVESAVVLCPDGTPQPFEPRASTPPGVSALPAPPAVPASTATRDAIPAGLTLDDAIRAYVQRALDDAGGNKTEAARQLGIGRNRLARVLGGE